MFSLLFRDKFRSIIDHVEQEAVRDWINFEVLKDLASIKDKASFS